jgi:hypothetical protein
MMYQPPALVHMQCIGSISTMHVSVMSVSHANVACSADYLWQQQGPFMWHVMSQTMVAQRSCAALSCCGNGIQCENGPYCENVSDMSSTAAARLHVAAAGVTLTNAFSRHLIGMMHRECHLTALIYGLKNHHE